jgi:hypothetical protein
MLKQMTITIDNELSDQFITVAKSEGKKQIH